jgi:hypothetical protein
MRLALAVILCFFSGSAVVSSSWTRMRPALADFVLRVCLAFGFGVGIFSVVFFVCRAFGISELFFVDLALLTGLGVVLAVRIPKLFAKAAVAHKSQTDWPDWFVRVLTATFGVTVSAALYAAVMRMKSFPGGDGWDAFAIWNLHARFLFLGGSHWRDGFTALLPWSHPDYPLLIPAAIAHFWSYLGWDDPRVAGVLGLGFTFATVGTLFGALSLLRGKVAAMLGAITLLATPFFIEQGTAQYADVALAFFYLATVVLLCLGEEGAEGRYGFFVLSGLAVSFAAWTKNEGLLFLCAVIVARVVIVFGSRKQDAAKSRDSAVRAGWMPLAALLAGIFPVLCVIAYFKRWIAPPSEMFADPKIVLHKVIDLRRYWAIVQWYGKGFLRFGHWLLIPGTVLLAGFYFVAGKDERLMRQAGFRTSVLALILTLAGYFAVYLVTPYDLYWHLRFSLTRLFLQVWPSAVFLFFLVVGGAGEESGRLPLATEMSLRD